MSKYETGGIHFSNTNMPVRIVEKVNGQTFIFQCNNFVHTEDIQQIRNEIKRQIQDGCVVLPCNLELVYPRLIQ